MANPNSNPFLSSQINEGIGPDQTNQNPFTTLSLHTTARTGQIITLALAKGVIIIALVFIILMTDDARIVKNAELFVPIGGAAFVLAIMGAFVVPRVLRSRAETRFQNHPELVAMDPTSRRRWVDWDARTPVPPPLKTFLSDQQTATLVGQATLEGSAVINLVFALLDGSWLHFVVAFLVVVGIVSMIPTVGKLRDRIENAILLR